MIHIYNFKPQFVAPIKFGTKLHTIRAERKDGRVPKPGDDLKLFTGLRQKGKATVIDMKPCVSVKGVLITHSGDPECPVTVCVQGKELAREELARLARNDGFSDLHSFSQYFAGQANLPLVGHLISWAEVEY